MKSRHKYLEWQTIQYHAIFHKATAIIQFDIPFLRFPLGHSRRSSTDTAYRYGRVIAPLVSLPLVLAIASLTFFCGAFAFAQETSSQSSHHPETTRVEEIEKQRAQYEQDIEALKVKLGNPSDELSASARASSELRLTHLSPLPSLLTQQIAVIDDIKQANERKERLTTGTQSEASPPSTFRELDAKRITQLKLFENLSRSLDEIELATTALETTTAHVSELEAAQRKLKEKSEEVGTLALADLKAEWEVSKELKRLRELELRFARVFREVLELEQQSLSSEVRTARGAIHLQQRELDSLVQSANSELKKASVNLAKAERALIETKSQMRKASDQGPRGEEELQSLHNSSRVRQETISLLRTVVALANVRRDLWKERGRLAQGVATSDELSKWNQEAVRRLKNLRFQEGVLSKGLLEAQKALLSIDESQPRRDGDYRKASENLLSAYREALKKTEETRLLVQLYSEELKEALPSIDWSAYYRTATESISSIWNFELLTTQDDRPITVKKIVVALLLLAIGYFLSRFLSVLFSNRILSRFSVTEAAQAAIQTLMFYLLFLIFALLALQAANVPLTVFTVLGGALAIGIGFGSQNIVNNFISGLILFTERPIKVGDLLQIEQTHGRVQSIGARSTVIRTSGNIDIIMPNSAFLEKSVTNWTRNDTNVRLCVTVGVVYGSPTDEVTRLLREAVTANGSALKNKETNVIFLDFGDNSVIFEVHFWARVRTMMEKKTIESELRYKIDELFRAHHIVIAFPQRDVHLDSVKPVEVRIVQTDNNTKEIAD